MKRLLNHRYVSNNLLSLMIGVWPDAVGISVFLSPKAFHDATIDFCIMCRFNCVRRSFLSCKFNKSVSLVFEYSYVLDGAEGGKCFLYQLVRDAVRETSAIYSAIGRTTLIIYLSRTTIDI